MTREPINIDHWEPCPSGLISQTAEQFVEPAQHRTLLWSTLAIALLMLLASYSLIEAQPVTPDQSTAVSCQTVRANLAAFCNDRISTVSLERSIGEHLIDCEACRQEYRSICNCSKRCPNRKRKAVTKPCMSQNKWRLAVAAWANRFNACSLTWVFRVTLLLSQNWYTCRRVPAPLDRIGNLTAELFESRLDNFRCQKWSSSNMAHRTTWHLRWLVHPGLPTKQ